MSAISATNSSVSDALVSLLRSNSADGADATTPASAKTDTSTKIGDGPVVHVDLSDRAKAVLERNKVEKLAADRLALQASEAKGYGKPAVSSKSVSDDASKILDTLYGSAVPKADSETKWTAGSEAGNASISDAEFTAKYKDSLLGALEGLPAEKQEALQAAINAGALKFQQGSEVAGYNTRTTVSYSSGPGGGQGMSTSGYSPPTGAVKEAIEAGNAVSLWTEDRGDVYVTW
jgi:hypothetical protein